MTQQEALDILKTGASVFLTGPAGSGKTHVLNQYIAYLRDKKVEPAITASTGIAATHLGGMTIHAWSGLGIRDSLEHSDLDDLYSRGYLKDRILNTHVLVIDEVSMLHHFRLDLVSQLLQFFKKNAKPFGGMQVILCGDFFQLPPVSRMGDRESRFAYHADSWAELDPKICYLEEQHRQTDGIYTSILNAMRDGSIDSMHHEYLQKRMVKKGEKKTEITKLYAHNVDVDAENDRELELIVGKTFAYQMIGKGSPKLIETLKKSCLAPETLRLKVGARVMFVKNNFEQGYANGTTGVVTACDSLEIEVTTKAGKVIQVIPASWHIEDQGKKLAEIIQYPLRLAWAITIHKSQGMSLDEAEIDLSKAFENGMGYVALSRVRTLDGLMLKGLGQGALRMHDEALEQDMAFRSLSFTCAEDLGTIKPAELKKMQQDFLLSIGSTEKGKKKEKINTVDVTKKMFQDGMTIKHIAEERGIKLETVISHLEEIKENDPGFNLYPIKDSISASKFQKIYAAFVKLGTSEGGKRPITPVKNALGPAFSFAEIRIVRLFL